MFIPTSVALFDFFISNFPQIYWYPYWYLGNPYHFLIGPVVPIALAIVQSSNFKVQSYDLYLGLIFLSFLIGAIGLYLFLRDWGVGKKQAFVSAILFLVLPAGVFLLKYQNGLNHIAFAALPFILTLYKRFLTSNTQNLGFGIFLSIAIAFVLLINISILLPLIIGFIALFVVSGVKKGVEEKIVKTILFLLLGLSIATIWYTPRFWWVILSNPSFGGVPLSNLVLNLFKLLLNLLPIALALLVVKWRRFKPQGYLLFAYLFFASFAFLSVVRFLSDPDFVMDWIGFFLELQFGAAIILGSLFGKFRIQNLEFRITVQNLKFLVLGLALAALVIFGWIMIAVDWFSNSNSEYKARIVSILRRVPEGERVFLSGSPVFFANSTLNISQVRGGMDQASIHPFWADAAFQIREGVSFSLAENWLKALGVSYVLVHGQNSSEPFHDFKHPEKFKKLELVDSQKRDNLYRAGGVSIGRIAGEQILEIPSPKNGADGKTLTSYIKTMKRPILLSFEKPNRIVIRGDIGESEVVSLAVSYQQNWHAEQGRALILKDSFGNMVIKPKVIGEQKISLTYSNRLWEYLIPGFFSLVFFLLILRFDKVYPYLSGPLSRLFFGIRGNDEDY